MRARIAHLLHSLADRIAPCSADYVTVERDGQHFAQPTIALYWMRREALRAEAKQRVGRPR